MNADFCEGRLSSFFNLDDVDGDASVIVVSYQGVKLPLSRTRILELIAREQKYLALLAGGQAPSTPVSGPGETPMPPEFAEIPNGAASISHGSLSSRTKKIYDFARDKQALRPAHAGLLMELLGSFDWVMPEHPKTRLDVHLAQIKGWRGTSDELREAIDRFLVRYQEARTSPRRAS